jgi:hypothetical protein
MSNYSIPTNVVNDGYMPVEFCLRRGYKRLSITRCFGSAITSFIICHRDEFIDCENAACLQRTEKKGGK